MKIFLIFVLYPASWCDHESNNESVLFIHYKFLTMKKYLIHLMLFSVVIIGLPGCKKTSEITCNLATATSQPPVEMNITYTATQSGDGTISLLSYMTIAGTVTVQNPSLPWSITVPALTSTNVSISASGTTKNGSLKIGYEGISGGATISGSDFCEQQTN
jgi:hypothetical protein